MPASRGFYIPVPCAIIWQSNSGFWRQSKNLAVGFVEQQVTAKDYRRIALSLPGATEGSHQGHPDFRVGGKIFCTLAFEKEGFGVLKLSLEEQAGLVEDAPEVFSPVPGGWGRMGMTRVKLNTVSADVLEGALKMAWKRRLAK
jgi:hypothetical protein